MRFGFKFFTNDSIEKSKKGVRRSSHKYIRVFTGNNGKDEYIYPEDMKNPFKKLLSIFAITKERIANVFRSEKIEENYGVDENTFAAHVLEYLTDKAKWDKFFSNPTVAHKNKAPVNLNKKKPGVKTEDKKVTEKKETEKKMTINRSLMRKIWGIFNPAKDQDSEAMFNSGNTESVIPAEEKIKDFVGRKTSIDTKTKITTMKWPDGREIKVDSKGNVIYDSTNIEPVEETPTVVEPDRDYPSEAARLTNEQLRIAMESMTNEVKRLNAANDTEGLAQANLWIQALNNEAEERKNRSNAMLGNDNAKKDIHDEEERAEFNSLTKRYAELDKEFKANGGYSYKRTTKEQDEKRRAASKEKSEVEEKLRELKAKISERNKGKMIIPAAYKDVTNTWLKRLAKGDTISWEWLDKKFGGHYGEILSFGDDFYIDLSGSTITNPVVRIKYSEPGRGESYVSVDVGEMNKDQYRPSFMNMWDSDTFSKVYATFESLKEKINNTEGNTPAEKFFNMVLGSDNEISKKTDNSIVPTYRFTKDGIKNKDGKLEKIRARINNEGTPDEIIDLMADGYSDHIPSIFFPENDSDAMTDYFDKDSAYVKPDHPYYNHLKVMALKNRLYRGRATKWGAMSKEDQDKLEKQIKDLEKTLTEPTDEELAAYRERRNHEEEVKEKWREGERAARRKEQEENERKKEVEATNKFIANLEKLAEMWRKDPPVILDGMTKDQAIETMEDRILKVKMEIKNSDDPETIASNTKFLEQLQQKLEAIRESPESEWATEEIPEEPETPTRSSTEIANELADVRRQMFTAEDEELEGLKTRYAALSDELKEATAREISAEEHQNRSNAMLGNQNAYKGLTNTELKLKNKQIGEEIGRLVAENEKLYDDNSGFVNGADDDPNSDYQKWLRNADKARKLKDEVGKITDERISRGVSDSERSQILAEHKAAYDGIKPETKKTPAEPTPVVEETPAVETETVEAEDEFVTPIPTINPDVARRVSDNSMSGHAGDVYQSDVQIEMKEFRDMFDTSKMNDQQKEYFQERLNSYAGLVGTSYNNMASKRLAAGPSWVVAGPAKYNFKRFEQKMNAEMRAYDDFKEKKDKFIKNTQKRLKELKYTGGAENEEEVKARVFEDYSNGHYSYNDKIENTDPYAIEKISGKIKFMENAHDVTLMYRKQCKKAGISTMNWNDPPEDVEKRKEVNREVIKLAQEKGYSIEQIKQGLNHPFPQNQTQEIARNKQRLEEMQKRKEAIEKLAEKEPENGGNTGTVGRVDFDGGYVYENLEMDRIQIIYDGKPDKDTISTLKHNGFHWTPSQGAWQRQLNRNGRMAVNRVFAETGVDKKIDIDGAGEVQKSDLKEDELFVKTFEFCDFYLGKSYNPGDLRHWKGKIFKFSDNGHWERFI
ncbi:MAG: hypothetical protein MJZ37_00865 [Bacilli bacterium]|nr:hypothetical protein [Bacilli bacterium]